MLIGMEITRHDGPERGRYEARVEGHPDVAKLTYTKAGDATLIADHTGVPEALRGQRIAQALVERLVRDARDEGTKIVPRCSYVKAQFDRHPEWSDLLAAG